MPMPKDMLRAAGASRQCSIKRKDLPETFFQAFIGERGTTRLSHQPPLH